MSFVAAPVEHVADGLSAPPEAGSEDLLDSGDAGRRYIAEAWLTGAYAVNLLLSLAAVPLVIRHLGPVDYGRFATVTAIIFIVAGFTEAGLTSLGVREYTNRSKQERPRLMRNLIGLRLTTTALGVLATMSILALVGEPDVVVLGLAVAGTGLMVRLVADNYAIPLNVQLRLGHTVDPWDRLPVCAMRGLRHPRTARRGVVPLLAVTIVSSGVQLLGIAVVVRGEIPLLPAFDVSVWRRLLRETLPFAAASAVGIIYFREALILMSFLSTGRQTGYYSAAFKIVEVLTTVPWILAASGLPILARAARDDSARLSYAVQRLFEVGLILGVWMSASTIVGAKLGIDVVAGAKFHPAIGVLEIQALAIVTSFIAAILGYALLSLRQYRQLLRANALAVLIVTVLSFVLIPAHGARGAAIAPTVAEALLGVAYAVSLARSKARLRLSLRIVPGLAVGLGVSLAVVYALPVSSELIRLVVLALVYFPLLRAQGDPLRDGGRAHAPRHVNELSAPTGGCTQPWLCPGPTLPPCAAPKRSRLPGQPVSRSHASCSPPRLLGSVAQSLDAATRGLEACLRLLTSPYRSSTMRIVIECLRVCMACWATRGAERGCRSSSSTTPQDGSASAIRSAFPSVELLQQQRRCGFGANHNAALRRAAGRHVLLLNDDTLVRPGAVDALRTTSMSIPTWLWPRHASSTVRAMRRPRPGSCPQPPVMRWARSRSEDGPSPCPAEALPVVWAGQRVARCWHAGSPCSPSVASTRATSCIPRRSTSPAVWRI